MKSAFVATVFASSLSAVAATGWGSAQSFPNPQNQNNVCSAEQKSGFDWSGLQTGSFNSFGGFSYSGFSCQSSFTPKGGRRGRLLRARDFSGKVIQGTAQKGSGSPSISCQSDTKMSISHFGISTDFDTDMDFIYSMADGSTCKQTSACKSGGSTIQNTQCGGANSVSFQMPSGGKDGGCGFGIHTIQFDCSPPQQPPTTSSSTTTSTTTSQVTTKSTSSDFTTTLSSTTVITSSTATSTISSSSSATPSSASTSVPTTTFSSTIGTSSSTSGVSSSTSSGVSTTTSYACSTCSGSSNTPRSSTTLASSTTGSTTTTSVSTTTTGSSSVTSGSSTTTPASSSPVTTSSTVLASTLSTTSATPCTVCQQQSPPPPNVPNAPCPSVLPSCLNTWLSIAPNCKSNSDTKCFCPNPEFAKNVISCVSAWAKDDKETQAALSYFAGICADFIPQNPGICTNVPSSITLQPSVPPQTAVVTQSGSTATITVVQPITTCTFTNTITASGITSVVTSVVTVPQVSFVTQAPTTTVSAGSTITQTAISVGLIPAQPQAAPATTTPAASSSSAVAAAASSSFNPVAATRATTSMTVTSTAYGTSTTTMALPKSSNGVTNPSVFTGAASKEQVGFGMVGGILALAAFFA